MDNHTTNNAMTEIALALAMGFFSIMVLAMVSMGGGVGSANKIAGAVMAASDNAQTPKAVVEVQEQDRMILYYNGHFFDQNMHQVKPETLPQGGRTILALAPETSMTQALKLRGLFGQRDVIVSTLDTRWIRALQEKTP
ncbi:hypothetical protein Mmc1_0191 [Magnetococcus marinus MC-1]|uniref:Uncharacterized protein n=1 Tax=Magnetococcus marinus (strain ATCC BAA-1437 / JCM 17883 / MC-1) TaxID=156889 RepID=A0L425_MAGMM|nr:hypothetical protein [Magnetococcus marinus]ABK42718.1 hypothetical protein Mmc1_0191 [Magnetococcus marinus MC-1]